MCLTCFEAGVRRGAEMYDQKLADAEREVAELERVRVVSEAQLADARTEVALLRDRLEKWQRNYTGMKDRAYAAEAKLAEVEAERDEATEANASASVCAEHTGEFVSQDVPCWVCRAAESDAAGAKLSKLADALADRLAEVERERDNARHAISQEKREAREELDRVWKLYYRGEERAAKLEGALRLSLRVHVPCDQGRSCGSCGDPWPCPAIRAAKEAGVDA